ncbi:MAG: hypothetical protein WD871_01090 [Xanthobacteraceae bacterium]
MRKSVVLMLVALFGSSVPVYAQEIFAAARVRVSLGQCIGMDNRCTLACARGVLLPPPWGGLSDLEYKQCKNQCDANHAACVDLAFSSRAAASVPPPPKPTKRPTATKKSN